MIFQHDRHPVAGEMPVQRGMRRGAAGGRQHGGRGLVRHEQPHQQRQGGGDQTAALGTGHGIRDQGRGREGLVIAGIGDARRIGIGSIGMMGAGRVAAVRVGCRAMAQRAGQDRPALLAEALDPAPSRHRGEQQQQRQGTGEDARQHGA